MRVNHEDGCHCVICSGEMTRKELTTKEARLMKKYGWYAHMVVADPYVATGFNYHTHGIETTFGHMDLQIVLPLRGSDCHGIASALYNQIKDGMHLRDGDEATIPHQNGSRFPVRFIKVREADRDVLRIILPNPEGKLEPKHVAEDDEPEYALQWTVSTV